MVNTVLVAEDDSNIRQVVSEYLKDAGFTVLTAENGRMAADMIEQRGGIDLYIFDIMLPEISGLELLKMVRMDQETPVIMLTALSDEYTQLISFEGMADDYVTKPFSAKILVKRVESLLRRNGKSGGSMTLGSITVNTESYEAFEDGERIILTLKELEILKALMNNPKKVISRQQLLNMVWGYDFFGDERIVDVHIKNLRKKLKNDIISTVKGVGYKLDL